ncbi:signal peptide peptidase SppA [bacterium]|nr:signal peptide peptidase SppA [bacterium]
MDAHKTIQSIFHILGILVILGFLSLQAGSCLLLVTAMNAGDQETPAGRAAHDEHLFGDESAEASFLRVPILGVISAEPDESLFGWRRASLLERTEELIDHAIETESIAGLLVDIDSPGGAVDPSDVIYQRLRRYSAETGKPVIARMNGLAASGGYYVAMGASRILAHPTCLTGSIGVLIQSWNAAGLFDKLGVELVTLTSGPNKDLLNPGKPMSKEHRAIIQGIVDDAYASFIAAVAEGRSLDSSRVRALADGRIYTARQAKALGLIDAVGYEEELLDLLREAANAETVRVVEHRQALPLWDRLAESLEGHLAGTAAPAVRLERRLDSLAPAPGLYYLWPGF